VEPEVRGTRSAHVRRRPAGCLARLRLASAVVALLVIASAGTVPAASAQATETTVRVMTFNIFYGGNELDLRTGNWCFRPGGCPETFDKVVEAIEASGADVVALQEAAMNTQALAERLGWHFDERMHVISTFPLVDPPGAEGFYTLIEVDPGRVVAIANTHLPAEPYGPYELRDGATVERVLEIEEETRLPGVRRHLERLQPLLDDPDMPILFAGDFNTPSHLDWTDETAQVRDIVVPLAWPVSVALAEAGFRDSYRDVFPDPVARPGFTWTPGGPEGVRDEVHDRIDWVLATGPLTTVTTEILGEKGGPDVDIEIDPYPTDHRGVVSTFNVSPADMPVLVAVDSRRVEAGDDLSVRFNGVAERVAIVAAGDEPGSEILGQPTGGDAAGTLMFATVGLDAAAYEALLVESGHEVLARIPFWVVDPGATPQVWTSKAVYEVGEPIEVFWKDAMGMRLDWLGIYSPGRNDASPHATTCHTWPCSNQRYLLWEYMDARIEGSVTFDAGSEPGWTTWPLRPGMYEIRMLLDDHMRSIASSAKFRVVR
jgi:endonuclease/exonuclease/phosphatase family metal-dependent hydrolase